MIRDNELVLRSLCYARRGARRLARGTRHVALVVGLLGAGGCTDWALYDLDRAWGSVPFLSTLRTSVSYDPYELPRLPAAGSVPLVGAAGEILPAFTQAQLDSVGAALTNPLPSSPEVLALGEQVYEAQCTVCHGAQGGGNGPVVGPGKFPLGPSLLIESATSRADGYLYGIIRVGRGLMPSYSEKVPHLERWAVVNYLRLLQRSGAPAAAPGVAAPSVPAAADPADPVPPAGAPGVADTARAAR